jgi:hypothetical protein
MRNVRTNKICTFSEHSAYWLRNKRWSPLYTGLFVSFRVLGYRSVGPGSIPGNTIKKVVSLEWGPLSLVSTTEELLDRKVTAPVYKIENTAVGIGHADRVAPSIRKKLSITSPTSGARGLRPWSIFSF